MGTIIIKKSNHKNNKIDFSFVEKSSCPSCDSKRIKYIGMRGGKYQRQGLGIETKIVQCLSCSLIFPNPFPIPESLESIYGDPDEYFSSKGDWEIRSRSYEGLVNNFIKLINKKRKIKLLDVGAGRGEFNKAALSFPQVECTGIEVSEGTIEFAKRHGIELQKKLLEELIEEGKSFDGICLKAVIEHVHEPTKFISEVSSLLKEGGVIFIDCPREPNLLTMIGNLANRIFGKKAVYNLQPTWEPYHVFGFNPKSLRILLEKNNIEITDIVVHGSPFIPYSGGFVDKVKVFIGMQIQRFANLISLGSNMYVWGKKL